MLDLKYNLLWLLLSRGSKDEVVTLRGNTNEAISLKLLFIKCVYFFENRKGGDQGWTSKFNLKKYINSHFGTSCTPSVQHYIHRAVKYLSKLAIPTICTQ